MSRQQLDLQLKGLYTAPNNLSAIPQGAMEVADNVVIDKINIVESRRGQTQYGSPLTVGDGQVNRIFNYASALITNYDDKMAYDSGNGIWLTYPGTYVPPSSDYKMRSLEALRNFYFTTDSGIFKIDSLTSTPRRAGVAKALSGTGVLGSSGSGFLQPNTAVAYRILWGYVDANNNLLLGAPSQRLVIANAGGTPEDVTLTYLIPDSITTEYFYQIYRSNPTLTATDEPDDNLQLVIQGNPTAGEIAAKSFVTTDITPFSLMRATIYTAPSQEGIANSNFEPPFALDMDVFKSCAFYANITQKQNVSIALISVDSPSLGYVVDASVDTHTDTILDGITSTADLRVGMRAVGTGIQSDSVIVSIDSATQVTISKPTTATGTVSVEFQDRFGMNNVAYWAGTTQDVATNTFLVDVSGTPAQNINNTALNLIEIINTSASNTTIYGYYISGLEDLPGQMLFEERTVGGPSFQLDSTAGTSFSPELPNRQTITSISVDDPTVITSVAHGLSSGDTITIFNSNSTPLVNGSWVVTVLTPDTFTIPEEVTIVGTTGYFIPAINKVASSNDARQNRVAISKPGQVESVPAFQFFDIGSANFPIQRVIALRDGIFFFKQDGIFRLSGETFSSFTVALVDNTTALRVPESAVPFNNQVFCFTDQGICAVSDSGVQLLSVPIENTLLQLSSDLYPNFVSASFGIAYESARQYMFFTVTDVNDMHATQAFIYNSLTKSWTRWIMDRTCGIVNTSIDKLFMAQTDTGQILIERKNFTNTDYADEQYPVVINSVDSTTQVTLVSATLVREGMTLGQAGRTAYIESVNGNVLTIVATTGLVTGGALVYEPIVNTVRWSPIDCENPGVLKQFSEISLMFRNAAFSEIEASFSTNVYNVTDTVNILNKTANGWGEFSWGEQPWGGVLGGQTVLRTYVPRNQQRGSWLYLGLETSEAFTGFSLQGVSVMFNTMSSRIK